MGMLTKMAAQGRNGDTRMAHVTPGEVVIPKEVATLRPDLVALVGEQVRKMGGNPRHLQVGRGRRNPKTGVEEFATEAEVAAAYQQYLGRAPDAAGMAFWAAQPNLSGFQSAAAPELAATGYKAPATPSASTGTSSSPMNWQFNMDGVRVDQGYVDSLTSNAASWDKTWQANGGAASLGGAASPFDANKDGVTSAYEYDMAINRDNYQTRWDEQGNQITGQTIDPNTTYSSLQNRINNPTRSGSHLVTNPATGQTYDITAQTGGTDLNLASMVNAGNWGALSGQGVGYSQPPNMQGMLGQARQGRDRQGRDMRHIKNKRPDHPQQQYGNTSQSNPYTQLGTTNAMTGYTPYQPYQGQQRTSGMFGAPVPYTPNATNTGNNPWAGNMGWSQNNPWSTR